MVWSTNHLRSIWRRNMSPSCCMKIFHWPFQQHLESTKSKLAKWASGHWKKNLETTVEYFLKRSWIYDILDVLEDNIMLENIYTKTLDWKVVQKNKITNVNFISHVYIISTYRVYMCVICSISYTWYIRYIYMNQQIYFLLHKCKRDIWSNICLNKLIKKVKEI